MSIATAGQAPAGEVPATGGPGRARIAARRTHSPSSKRGKYDAYDIPLFAIFLPWVLFLLLGFSAKAPNRNFATLNISIYQRYCIGSIRVGQVSVWIDTRLGR